MSETARQRASATAKRGAKTQRRRRDPLVKAEQQRQVVSMWVAGATVEQIERVTKLSSTTIYRIRREALATSITQRDTARADLLERELMTLDALQASHWASRGDKDSAQVILKCIAQRAKILGLEAPVRHDLTVKSELDAEIEQLIGELNRMGVPITTKEGAQA